MAITDNAKPHKVGGAEELIESKGAKLIYLPPYSPELSAIEMCWSEIRHFPKKAEARTEESSDEAISEVLNLITKNDTKGWFGHCGYVI